MKKLDFGFLPHDDTLEAKTIRDGVTISYAIFADKIDFKVTGWSGVISCPPRSENQFQLFEVGVYPNLYQALDAANDHCERNYGNPSVLTDC